MWSRVRMRLSQLTPRGPLPCCDEGPLASRRFSTPRTLCNGLARPPGHPATRSCLLASRLLSHAFASRDSVRPRWPAVLVPPRPPRHGLSEDRSQRASTGPISRPEAPGRPPGHLGALEAFYGAVGAILLRGGRTTAGSSSAAVTVGVNRTGCRCNQQAPSRYCEAGNRERGDELQRSA